MSKKGLQRRTPEKRIADREQRSTLAYLRRLAAEVETEQREAPETTGKQ